MCRPRMLLSLCLFCVLLLGGPAVGRAQPVLAEVFFEPRDFAKERAKALFESTRITTRDLARARLEAAQIRTNLRYWMYRSGAQDVTLDLLLEAAASLAKAALSALEMPTPAERLKPARTHWLYNLSAEQIVEAKYRVGRASLADFMQARQDRLGAEITLRDAGGKLSEPFPLASLLPSPKNSFVDFVEQEAAKRAAEMGQVDRHDLARQRREAAHIAFQVRDEKYRAGAQDATLDLLLKSAVSLLEAELAALPEPTQAHRRTFFAARWLYSLSAEQIVEAKYNVGRVSRADLAQAQHARLDAEIKLRRAEAGEKLPNPFVSDAPLNLDVKTMAKRAYEAGQTDLRALAQARRDAIRVCMQVRMETFRAGAQDATLDLLLEAAHHLLEAELALHDDPAERLAAHERYWEFAREAEIVMQAKYQVGRVSIADYMEARSARLHAEILMRQARAKMNVK